MITDQPGDILAKTARGAGWVIAWRMATRLLGLVNTLVLVHLLAPSDFGLVALGYSFVVAIDSLSTFGIDRALIQERSPTRELYDTGFTLNLLRCAVSAAILAIAAAPIARFFSEPRLATVLLALAVATLVGSLVNIGTVDFRRDLAFDKEFRLLVVPRLGSIAVAVAVALIWRSYWALISGILTGHLLGVAFSYVMHPYRPRLTLRGWRHLAGFSFWSWMISLAALVRDRSDTFVIGRVLGSTAVGIYEIGTEIGMLPITELVSPIARATFPGFSAARHSGMDAAETYRRIVAAVVLVTLPAGIGISLVADPLVRLALGAQWLGATPLLQILGVAGTITVLGTVSGTLYSAHGVLRPAFGITATAAAVRIVLLVLLIRQFGLVGGAIAVALGMLLEHTGYVVDTCRRFGVQFSDLLRSTWRCLLATAAMAATLMSTGLGWQTAAGSRWESAWTLAAAVAIGLVSYAGTLLALWITAGRPPGAESDLARVIVALFGRFWLRVAKSNRRPSLPYTKTP